MSLARFDKRLTATALAAGLVAAAPQWAVGQGVRAECKGPWSKLEAAAKAGHIKATADAQIEIADDPDCNYLNVSAKEVVLGVYKAEDARLERAGAAPAVRLANLRAALEYRNDWNAWDVFAKIGDLNRRTDAGGQPNYAAISLAYDQAVQAIDKAPPEKKPAVAQIERLMALAYQFEALSPTAVPTRAAFTRTGRQINLKRTPIPLQFVYNSDQLTEAGLAKAGDVFELLKEERMPQLHLVGHTDPKGSDEYNDKLSVRRAVAVKSFLVARGYPAGKITTEGRGKRDADKLKIVEETDVAKIHQILRRVELIWD